jgi:hypothetical protein
VLSLAYLLNRFHGNKEAAEKAKAQLAVIDEAERKLGGR